MIEKISGFTVVEDDDSYLLTLERKQGQYVLGLVGGTMDPEDFGNPENTALREGWEESGAKLALTGLLSYSRTPMAGNQDAEQEKYFFVGTLADDKEEKNLNQATDFFTYKEIKRLHERDVLRSNGTWEAIRAARKTEPMPVSSWIDLSLQSAMLSKQSRRKSEFLVAA